MNDLLTKVAGSAVIIGFGALEGYVFARSGVVAPSAMKDQMSFASMAVMKMFMGAVGSSMVAQSLMDVFMPAVFSQTRNNSNTALPATIVATGSCILGAGMYLCGSGPTMMPSQLATGVPTAPYILAGAFAGAAAFGMTKAILPASAVTRVAAYAVDRKMGLKYVAIAAPIGIGMVALSWGLEKLMPSSTDNAKTMTLGSTGAIYPTLAGCVLGLNQIPLRLIAGGGQGGSTAVSKILATFTGGLIHPELRMTTLTSSLNVLYVYVGTFIGALMAGQGGFSLRRTEPAPEDKRDAFVGAFLMLYGARLAGGCTCGHGVTGVSELVLTSMLSAACIFGSGMATAALRQYL